MYHINIGEFTRTLRINGFSVPHFLESLSNFTGVNLVDEFLDLDQVWVDQAKFQEVINHLSLGRKSHLLYGKLSYLILISQYDITNKMLSDAVNDFVSRNFRYDD